MSTEPLVSPLLHSDSPLEDHHREVVRRIHEAELTKIKALPTDDALDPKRRRRVAYTRDEMYAQPEAMRRTLAENAESIRDAARTIAQRHPRRAVLVGCGDSLGVMYGVRYLLEQALGCPAEPMQALDFAYYGGETVDRDTLVIALSSSGETTRTVEAQLVAQHRGALTLAVTNTPDSTLEQESDATLRVAATRKGWPTQASTAAMALLARLALDVAALGAGPLDAGSRRRYEAALDALPDHIARTLEQTAPGVQAVAEEIADRDLYLHAAGGPAWAAAFIGAAKIKECTPNHAIAIPLEEFHHYNSQKPDDPLWLTAPTGRSVPRALDTAREAHRYGGRVFIVHTTGDQALAALADRAFALPAVPEALAPALYTVPAQLLAYHLAEAKVAAAERM